MEALLQRQAFDDHCSFDSKILTRIQGTQNILYGAVTVTQMTTNTLNEQPTGRKDSGKPWDR